MFLKMSNSSKIIERLYELECDITSDCVTQILVNLITEAEKVADQFQNDYFTEVYTRLWLFGQVAALVHYDRSEGNELSERFDKCLLRVTKYFEQKKEEEPDFADYWNGFSEVGESIRNLWR